MKMESVEVSIVGSNSEKPKITDKDILIRLLMILYKQSELPNTTMKESKGKRRGLSIWGRSWHQFCKDTTFHGFNHIAENQPFVIRRIIWSLLCMGGMAIFIIMMVNSIMYYYSWPVTVNIKINYNDTLVFPAVTICNQNAFRMTATSKANRYFLVTKLFEPGRKTKVDLSKYNASNLTLEDVYRDYGHSKHDLIVTCVWNGENCSADDFLPVLTDHSLCYTFNSGLDGKPIRKATKTGADGGLSLQLNVEQYEYMRGPNTGAGLKVLLHDQGEAPLVHDHGIVIAPGSHALVSTQILKVKNLPHPYGKCNDSIQLRSYDHYTRWNCLADYKSQKLQEMCNCHDMYMISYNDSVSPCTLEQFQDCILPKFEVSKVKSADINICAVPCSTLHFEALVSSASTSNFDVDNLLSSNYTKRVKTNYIRARETFERLNPETIQSDTDIINYLNVTFREISKVLNSVTPTYQSTRASLKKVLRKLNQRVQFHWDRGLKGVQFIAEHDFIRGWEIMEERTLNYIMANYYDIPTSFERTVMQIQQSLSEGDKEVAKALWFQLDSSLRGRLMLAFKARDNITEVHQAYKTGNPLIKFRSTIDRRYDMSYVSLRLLQEEAAQQDLYYSRLMEFIDLIVTSIETLRKISNDVLENRSLNSTTVQNASYRLLKGGRGYYYRMFQFRDRIVLKPKELIDNKIEDFLRLNRSLFEAADEVDFSIEKIQNLAESIRLSDWSDIMTVVNISNKYLLDQSIYKTTLAGQMLEYSMSEKLRTLRVSFTELRSLVQDLNTNWENLNRHLVAIWQSMLDEYTTKAFYKMIYDDYQDLSSHPEEKRNFYYRIFFSMLRKSSHPYSETNISDYTYLINSDFHIINIAEKIQEIDSFILDLSNKTDIIVAMKESDIQFMELAETWHNTLIRFLHGNNIDAAFYRENFLRMDLFMKELSYEEIIQEKAYDVTKLLGDIGGSLGLFIGASCLSVIEIIDVVFHSFFRSMIGR